MEHYLSGRFACGDVAANAFGLWDCVVHLLNHLTKVQSVLFDHFLKYVIRICRASSPVTPSSKPSSQP